MIKVSYFGPVREFTNLREEDMDAATLGEVMENIRVRYGKKALKAMRASMLTLDGARVESLKKSTPLPDGSVLGVYPLCGGG